MAISEPKVYNYEDKIVFDPKPGIPRADDSRVKENKGKWKWLIAVQRVKLIDPPNAGPRKEHPIRGIYYEDDPNAQPIVVRGKPYPWVIEVTTGAREQEFELIDSLTNDRDNIHRTPTDSRLSKRLRHEPDGLYGLNFYKQSIGAQYEGQDVFAFWGWNLVSKNADVILMETRYIQRGYLDGSNIDQRDPREDARNKHPYEIPSGGIDYVW